MDFPIWLALCQRLLKLCECMIGNTGTSPFSIRIQMDIELVNIICNCTIVSVLERHINNFIMFYLFILLFLQIQLILELLTVDLRKLLINKSKENENQCISEHILLNYCRQISIGMAYLSSKGFIHTDLAARNILVSEDDICKVIIRCFSLFHRLF